MILPSININLIFMKKIKLGNTNNKNILKAKNNVNPSHPIQAISFQIINVSSLSNLT